MQDTRTPVPKQRKLLGATVTGLGLIVAVEANLQRDSYALLETADGATRRVLLADLRRDEVVILAKPRPYVKQSERVAYGVWDEVYALVPGVALPAPAAVVLPVAA